MSRKQYRHRLMGYKLLVSLLYGQHLWFITREATGITKVSCGPFSRHLRLSIGRFKGQLSWLQEYGFITNLQVGRSDATFTLKYPTKSDAPQERPNDQRE